MKFEPEKKRKKKVVDTKYGNKSQDNYKNTILPAILIIKV